MGIDLGKIMVTPRGDYQDYVEYDRLDLVAYKGSSYIALKPVEGITPSDDGEYWQLHGSGAYQCAKEAGYEGTEEEFREAMAGVPDLKDAFTQHKSAKNPHGTTASDVGIKQDVYTADCNNATDANITYYTDGSTLNVPTTTGEWFIIQNVKRQNGFLRQIAYSMSDSRIFYRYCFKSTWGGWTTEFLPLTGGTLIGILSVGSGYGRINASADGISFSSRSTANDDTKMRTLIVHPDTNTDNLKICVNLVEKNGTKYNTYRLFGEHNKPSGSYTGNGSATSRTINTGGIGSFMIVVGGGCFSFVTNGAAMVFETSTNPRKTNSASFANGVLTLSTTEKGLNQSGNGYSYYVF